MEEYLKTTHTAFLNDLWLDNLVLYYEHHSKYRIDDIRRKRYINWTYIFGVFPIMFNTVISAFNLMQKKNN